MLKIFEHLLVVFGKYNSNDNYIGRNTKQAKDISENFHSNLNLFVQY